MRKTAHCEVLFWPAIYLLLLLTSRLAYGMETTHGRGNTARQVPNQNSACNSTLALNGTSGDIVSYNHPEQYGNNLDCSWLIDADPVPSFNLSVVKVSFQAFDVAAHFNCEYDYLTIYDGSSDNSSVLAKLCGIAPPLPILASGLQVYARFISDEFTTRAGFHITWEVINMESEPIPMNQNEACINPPLTLRGEEGHIVSWNYPQNYANNLRCAWEIYADANANFTKTGIQLDVEYFDVEPAYGGTCRFDYIIIHDGSSESPAIGRYCGKFIPHVLVLSSTKMYMTFTTDGNNIRQGFFIKWKTVDVANTISQNDACVNGTRPVTLTGDQGEIVSWHYPSAYYGNLNCAWRIQAASAFDQGVVMLTFKDFSLDPDTKCLKDSLTIHDGLSESSFILGQFCGSLIPPPVLASGKDMYVKFRSSPQHSILNYRFRLLWNISQAENTTSTANHTAACTNPPLEVSGTEGDIFSWNYPGDYANNLRCSWVITVKADAVVRLTFLDFETEEPCTRDYVTVYEKLGSDLPDKQFGKFCGSELPGIVAISSTNKIFVTFHSDVTVTERGLHLRWEMMDKVAIEDQNSACTNPPLLLTGSSTGQIVSYNYPDGYQNNQDCAWKVSTTNDNNFQNPGIELIAERFELEPNDICRFDYLRVYDGPSAESPMIGQYCGKLFPNGLFLYSTEIYLTFHSDATRTYPGFRLFWNVTDMELSAGEKDALSPTSPEYILEQPLSSTGLRN